LTRVVPKCSIVIPAYNMQDTIVETLDSCLAQSARDVEIVVVDDDSTDGTAEAAAAHAAAPRVIGIPHTGIPGAVRNVGVLAARGIYLQFLDADDIIAPEKIASQLALLDREPAGTVAYCDYAFFTDEPEGRRLERRGPADSDYWPEDLAGAFARYTVIHRFLFPRKLVLDARLFDPDLSHAEDLDLWLRLTIGGTRFAYQARALAFYREHVSHSLSAPEQERWCRVLVARKVRRLIEEAGLADLYSEVIDEIEAREVEAHRASVRARLRM